MARRGGAGADWSRLALAAGATLSAVFVLFNVTQIGLALSAGGLAEPTSAFELVWQIHAAAFALALPILGTTFIGAALAAYAIERATGLGFAESTQSGIFRPLGMSSTGWFLSEVDPARHSRLYDASAGSPVEIPLYGLATYPDGGLRTSVSDLSRFFLALLNGGMHDGVRILAPPSAGEMQRFQYTPENRPGNVQLAEKNSGIFWSTKMDVTFIGAKRCGALTDFRKVQ